MALHSSAGFTLVELMIVVAIVAILAAIALPQMGSAIRKSQEGCTKGNLGTLRSAISIYYGDNESTQLLDLNALWLGQKYIAGIPQAYYPTHHDPNTKVGAGNTTAFLLSTEEGAAWWLFTDAGNENKVVPNCYHSDMKGKPWTSY